MRLASMFKPEGSLLQATSAQSHSTRASGAMRSYWLPDVDSGDEEERRFDLGGDDRWEEDRQAEE